MKGLTHKQTLQAYLRNQMVSANMTYQDFGDLVGESRQSIHQTLTSDKVSLDKIISLCEKLGYEVMISVGIS
jgi:hypothetical protein